MPGQLRLTQIILYCEDMSAQVVFYRDVMGLSLVSPAELEDYSTEDWVTFESSGFSLALHSGGRRHFGDDAPRLVFAVDNIVRMRDHLRGEGVVMSDIFSPAPGIKVAAGCDPEGNHFSIKESG